MTPSTAPRRILIVEDEPANVRVLAEALGDAYDIRIAPSAAQALQLAATVPFDLVLLDVMLPDRSGHDVLRELKAAAATRAVPVIFVTARDEVADEAHGLALGAVDYIAKPISAPIVRARVATHLELKAQRDLLERLAAIDGLTGVANRRRFDEALAERLRALRRDGEAFAVVLVDVDHFKLYNDHYGHGPGDECLRRIAGALASAVARPGELAARYGGEEFAALARGPAADAARRVLAAVRVLELPHARSATASCVTASVGALDVTAEAPADGAAVMAAVDALLYEAKHGGRNRAVVAGTTAAARTVVTGETTT